ncbi:MAG: TIGR04551 family protein [Deltaproteobacteria bacterium]|nr:TIGR04551 family protein [Deltaproteobacteria bacterium]
MVRYFLVVLFTLTVNNTQAQEQPVANQESADKPAANKSDDSSVKNEATASPTPLTNNEFEETQLADWDRADWQLVQTKTALFDIKGYFRFRTDLLRRLNFGNGTVTEFVEGLPAPRLYATSGDNADFAAANMRLRIQPTINVSENIHIVSMFDILDNVVLGSTAKTNFTTNQNPTNILNQGTATVNKGVNSVTDAIVVRQLYGQIHAFNEQLELRFGRMPSDWGLGILSNSGSCLDCNYGDVVDRLSVTFKLADLIFVPMYDWVSSGPVLNTFNNPSNIMGRSGGQPLDAVPWDDVDQFSLRILRLDLPETIRERVNSGQTVFNYGVWGIWRRQARDLSSIYYTDPNSSGDTQNTAAEVDASGGLPKEERRDSSIFTVDGFTKTYFGGFELGIEAAGIFGSYNLQIPSATASGGTTKQKISVYQFGAALDATYRASSDMQGLILNFKTGGASGDSAPGFGALDRANTQYGNTVATEDYDNKITNFQFNPDYRLDLLLFREIIGTVTDAWYLRPEIAYVFSNNISSSFAAIYSQALFRRSTPRGAGRYRDAQGDLQGARGSLPLGLEFNAEISYGLLGKIAQTSPIKLSIAGGLLFPLSGFKNTSLTQDQDGSFSWTIQTRTYITF